MNMGNMGNNNLMGNRKKLKKEKTQQQMRRSVLAPYANKRDTVVVKNLPDHYNSVNCLMDYFKRFGDICNVSTFTKEKLAVIQYKKESFAKRAATFDTKPFNLNSLRIYIAAEGENSALVTEPNAPGFPNKKFVQKPPNMGMPEPEVMSNDDSSSSESISQLLKDAAPKKIAPPESPFHQQHPHQQHPHQQHPHQQHPHQQHPHQQHPHQQHPHTPPPQQQGSRHFNNVDPHAKSAIWSPYAL